MRLVPVLTVIAGSAWLVTACAGGGGFNTGYSSPPKKGCRKSMACADSGLCTEHDGKCIATEEADCLASSYCKNEGRCHVRDGECRPASEADCVKTHMGCKVRGRCGYSDAQGGMCVPRYQEDCANSMRCKKLGPTDGPCYFVEDKIWGGANCLPLAEAELRQKKETSP